MLAFTAYGKRRRLCAYAEACLYGFKRVFDLQQSVNPVLAKQFKLFFARYGVIACVRGLNLIAERLYQRGVFRIYRKAVPCVNFFNRKEAVYRLRKRAGGVVHNLFGNGYLIEIVGINMICVAQTVFGIYYRKRAGRAAGNARMQYELVLEVRKVIGIRSQLVIEIFGIQHGCLYTVEHVHGHTRVVERSVAYRLYAIREEYLI